MTGYPKTIALSRRSGQKQDFLIRRCIDTDLYEILRLQRIIDEDLADPGIYSLVDEEDILESLKVDHCYGAYVGDRLVGFTAMIDNRVSLRNYGSYVGYTPEQQKKSVSMEISFVDKDFRGYGLQRCFVEMREEIARELGATESFVTIGPDNRYSLNNLQKEGYEIIDTRPLYGGAMRHILRKVL